MRHLPLFLVRYNITATANTLLTGNQLDIKSASPVGAGAADLCYSILISG